MMTSCYSVLRRFVYPLSSFHECMFFAFQRKSKPVLCCLLLIQMARAAYAVDKEPMSAAIFYLAMNKSSVLASLYRSKNNRTRENFFRSDFSPGSAACKQAKMNAFHLLSQHKYLEAAALFLVGNSLEDAVRVCLHTLKDLQLAVFICRLVLLQGRYALKLKSWSSQHRRTGNRLT